MTLPPEKLQEMRDARRAALLAKWSAGARLNPDERAEIADLIGEKPAASPAPESAPPAPVAVQSSPAAPAAPALVLESPPSAAFSSRSGCIHPLIPGTPYETTYEVSVRQIKRWRARGAGLQPPCYPPLDEPWRMAAWYRQVMERRVPARLEQLEAAGPPPSSPAAEQIAEKPAPVPAAVEPPPPVSVVPRIPPSPPAPVANLATGYAATLERLSQAEATAAQRYADAVASADPEVRAQATALKKEWVDLAETVRAYERDRGKVLRESDAIWDKTAVLEAVSSVHNVIAPGIRRLLRTCRRRYARVFASLPPEADALFADEADALFSVLLNSRFTATTGPEAEPPAPDPEPPAPEPIPMPAAPAEPPALAA